VVNRRKAEQIVAKVLEGRSLRDGLIEATVPDIAEDGSAVPVSFLVNCSMKNDDYPKTVHVIGMVNPTPEVARYHFTPACGEAAVVFRCRMHASSYLSFIANMADGTVGMTQQFVSVTASGCI
jgi:sulfur-oxidizing protein SoxY